MTRYLFLAVFLSLSYNTMSQQKQFVNPRSVGYSDEVIVQGGKTIYVSGQVPVNESGEIVGRGDLRTQTVQVFENIKKLLAQAGANFKDVVKVNVYIVNCKPTDVAIVREVRKSYLSDTHPPASTMVGVTSLVDPEFLIEIEVVASIE
jgi:enamine deaminase RidA (YjgF/YER057c/UK114 family)